MSDSELALLLIAMVRDWLDNASDGWYRLGNFLENRGTEIPDGKPWGDFEERVYAQLDKWEKEAGGRGQA